MMRRCLDVYLHEDKIGILEQSDDGQLIFSYRADYLADNATALSVAMPLREAPFPDAITRPFFSGLLPDDGTRKRLAAALGVSQDNAFGLLEIVGGECAGALCLLPQGKTPPDYRCDDSQPLSDTRLSELLALLRQRPLLGGRHGVRLSLAGVQDKLAVCVIDAAIALPQQGRPTTHILKPSIEYLDGAVENELFCMKLAAKMGLNAPSVAMSSVGKTDFILIERYDRHLDNAGKILRRHQEDFCQALSIPPEMKYEDEGGPGVSMSQHLIQTHTRHPAADRISFQKRLIFHYLIGNADAHAKNFSLLYNAQTPDLAPLYDVVCTAAYPHLAKGMAMKIGGRALPDTIRLKHWLTLVAPTKTARTLFSNTLLSMAIEIERQANALLIELDTEGIRHPILKAIGKVISTRAGLIQRAVQ